MAAASAAAAAAAAQRTRVKRFIWAGSFAAITIVGTIYGAGLKSRQEYKSEVKKYVQASAEEQIAILEQRKKALVSQKAPLEEKLASLRGRMAENREKEREKRERRLGSAATVGEQPPPPPSQAATATHAATPEPNSKGRKWWLF